MIDPFVQGMIWRLEICDERDRRKAAEAAGRMAAGIRRLVRRPVLAIARWRVRAEPVRRGRPSVTGRAGR